MEQAVILMGGPGDGMTVEVVPEEQIVWDSNYFGALAGVYRRSHEDTGDTVPVYEWVNEGVEL